MLTAKNIHKVYRNPSGKTRDVHVLKGVSLEISKGEIVTIVGPSGAGKSTLLHALGGIDRPTNGQVFFHGKDVYSLPDGQRARMRNESIGFIFQFYHLLPEFSALENVVLPAMIKTRSRLTASMRTIGLDLLRRVGMRNRADHRPNELSGGEQQRVAIARALVNQPDVLFCDEPTGNLDSRTGAQVIELLLELNSRSGQSLVIVTHDEHLAGCSGRVIHLRDGQICAAEPDPSDPCENPAAGPEAVLQRNEKINK